MLICGKKVGNFLSVKVGSFDKMPHNLNTSIGANSLWTSAHLPFGLVGADSDCQNLLSYANSDRIDISMDTAYLPIRLLLRPDRITTPQMLLIQLRGVFYCKRFLQICVKERCAYCF